MSNNARSWRVVAGGVAAGIAGVLGFAGNTASAEPAQPAPPAPVPVTVTQTVTVAPTAAAATAVAATPAAPGPAAPGPEVPTTVVAQPALRHPPRHPHRRRRPPHSCRPVRERSPTSSTRRASHWNHRIRGTSGRSTSRCRCRPAGARCPTRTCRTRSRCSPTGPVETGLYTSNAQLVATSGGGRLRPAGKPSHTATSTAQQLANWQSTDASLAEFGGFPSSVYRGHLPAERHDPSTRRAGMYRDHGTPTGIW